MRYYSLTSACILVAVLLSSCDSSECERGGMATSCPPPATGFAQVNGRALRSDGSPVVGKQANVGCGEVVGVYNDATDAEGNFEVRPVYAVNDTLLYPYPPRAADGSFTLSCRVILQLASNNLLVQDPLPVRFATAPAGVVPTVVELREAALDQVPGLKTMK
jgi:hypothetical protein